MSKLATTADEHLHNLEVAGRTALGEETRECLIPDFGTEYTNEIALRMQYSSLYNAWIGVMNELNTLQNGIEVGKEYSIEFNNQHYDGVGAIYDKEPTSFQVMCIYFNSEKTIYFVPLLGGLFDTVNTDYTNYESVSLAISELKFQKSIKTLDNKYMLGYSFYENPIIDLTIYGIYITFGNGGFYINTDSCTFDTLKQLIYDVKGTTIFDSPFDVAVIIPIHGVTGGVIFTSQAQLTVSVSNGEITQVYIGADASGIDIQYSKIRTLVLSIYSNKESDVTNNSVMKSYTLTADT